MTYDGAMGGPPWAAAPAPGAPAPSAPARRSPAARARAVGLRLGAAAVGAAFLGALKINRPPGLATVCVLRGTTGVPCPLCGATTVFVRLGQGRFVDAVLTNPVVLLVALGLVLAPTGVFGRLAREPRVSVPLAGALAAVSWAWQLGRFGLLS